jgi:hypothetical protein
MTTALSGPGFRPSGYLYKRVVPRPDWLKAPGVEEILSVSGCVSPAFADYIPHWKHNGFWLFDVATLMRPIAEGAGVDLAGHRLFYLETLAEEFDDTDRIWQPVEAEPSMPVNVAVPKAATLRGFDVVSFSAGNAPECSPLSCNGLAADIPTNRHCLMDGVAAARAALDAGRFMAAEPGPYRIMAVYEVS